MKSSVWSDNHTPGQLVKYYNQNNEVPAPSSPGLGLPPAGRPTKGRGLVSFFSRSLGTFFYTDNYVSETPVVTH